MRMIWRSFTVIPTDVAVQGNRIYIAITVTLIFLQSFMGRSTHAFGGTNMLTAISAQTTARAFPSSSMFDHSCFTLYASSYTNAGNSKLSDLPIGISPFEKSLSKSIDVQADFRSRAKVAVNSAISAGIPLIEIEFPPLIGGQQVSVSRLTCVENE
jgi:hypothetical protein